MTTVQWIACLIIGSIALYVLVEESMRRMSRYYTEPEEDEK